MRTKRGLVQAHLDLLALIQTVPGNVTRTRMVVRPEPPAIAGRFECAGTFLS